MVELATVETAECEGLPHEEQVKLVAHLAVSEALSGKPAQLGELWMKVEELSKRRESMKEIATKYAALAKIAEQEQELLTSALLGELQERKIPKVDAGFGLVSRKTVGGNQAVMVTGPVPAEYQRTKTETLNDLKLIGEKLREGAILSFACLAPRKEQLSLEAV
jgi:hypothetical protein